MFSNDQIRTANGAGMSINRIYHAVVRAPCRNLHLKNVLHVPHATKNLVSVHRLASDNRAFLEFHPNFFLIKDKDTKKVLLEGKCKRGLYPIPAPEGQLLSAVKPSSTRWHNRLGHPALPIVNKVISQNKLPCSGEVSLESVVMPANKQKVISFRILSPTVCLRFP